MKIDQNLYLNSNSVNGSKNIPSSNPTNSSSISDLIPENSSGRMNILSIFLNNKKFFQGACIKVGNEFQVSLSEYDRNQFFFLKPIYLIKNCISKQAKIESKSN